MGIRVIDPQIANRTRARKNRNLSNSSYTVPNLDGRTGAMGSTKRGANVVDAGERDAPKFPPAFTGKGTSSSDALGSLEGLTGQFGSALGKASREAEAAAKAKFIAERNALGDPDRFAGGQLEGGLGLVGNAARDIANKNSARNLIRDHYGLKGDIGNTYQLADAGSLGVTPLGNESSGGGGGEGGGTFGGDVLNDIEADLMSGGRQFGDLKTLQGALVKLRGSLNANELQRSRRLEDFALALDEYRRKSDRYRRQIPGGFNKRGMLNSGQFDRGMGEFESQVIRDELGQRHKLQRVLQDLGFADRSAGYEFDETIRENAIDGALASARKAAAFSVPGLDGGYSPVGENRMNQYGGSYMDSIIKSIYGRD